MASIVTGFTGKQHPSIHRGATSARLLLMLGLLLGAGLLSASSALAAPPVVTVQNASEVGYLTAHVAGTVDPGGEATTYRFQYATQADFSDAATGIEVGGIETAGPVSGELTGLAPGTTYHLRLLAENASDPGAPAEAVAPATFTTKAVETPTVTIKEAASVSYLSAKAEGTVELAGTDPAFNSSCEFQYATEADFSNATAVACEPATVLGSEAQPVTATANLTGLAPGTTYHLRIVAANAGGLSLEEAPATFTTLAVATPTVEVDEATLVTGTSAHFSGEVTPGGTDPAFNSSCHFDYVTDAQFNERGFEVRVFQNEQEEREAIEGGYLLPVPCSINPVTGVAPAAVEADVSGLIPNTTYHFRLRSSNAGGETAPEAATFTTLAVAPTIDATFASNLSATAVDLGTQVNPGGAPTSCRFEYSTDPSFATGAKSAPCVPAALGAGNADVAASVHLQGLSAATEYHYRIIAQNAYGTATGTTHTFTTQSSGSAFGLLDGRSYEMVSPLEKAGGDIAPLNELSTTGGGVIQATPEGNTIAYVTFGAFGAPLGAPLGSNYIATRTLNGWGSENITTPEHNGNFPKSGGGTPYYAFSSALTKGLILNGNLEGVPVQNPPLTADALPGYQNFYLRNDLSDSLQALLTTTNTTADPQAENLPSNDRYGVELQGATPDLDHIIFRSVPALTANATDTGERNLYEWSGGGLELINVLPGNTQGTPGASLGAEAGAASGGSHAVSDDGSRVVFTETTSSPPELFVRDVATGSTVAVDESRGGVDPSGNGVFRTASSDGSRVLFTDRSQLTPESHTAGPGGGKSDLYEFDVPVDGAPGGGRLVDLTSDVVDPDGAEVQGVLGASADGSYVYFVANGVLGNGVAKGATRGSCVEQSLGGPVPSCNLYVAHEGSVSFIARVSEDDKPDWALLLDGNTSRVSRDGRRVLFGSDRSLTGFDNRDAVTGRPDSEVFLYEVGVGLTCVSCGSGGARPDGGSSVPGGTEYATSKALYRSRVLSEGEGFEGLGGGARVFFDSSAGLVSQDTNGREDVYEWESAGTGSCASTSGAAGCLGLVSSGTDSSDSSFVDASEDGDNVFFVSRAQLVGGDTDRLVDLYDARVGGGFPEPPSPPACEGDACLAPPVAPIDPPLSSASYSGPGNLIECRKGKKLKQGKCVKHKAKKQKRHSKKKTHKPHTKVNRGAGK